MTITEIRDALYDGVVLNFNGVKVCVVDIIYSVEDKLLGIETKVQVSKVGTRSRPFTLTSSDFDNLTIWEETMQNKNDKIVELIKAYLDGKTLQPTAHHPSGCYSDMDDGLKSLINTVIAHPDAFKIKPETKKITVRSWLSRANTPCTLFLDNDGTREVDIEACGVFKQWLDPEPRVYEVEV